MIGSWMLQKKICMLGSFAVGKTSLVRRFVHSSFSDDYQTTIGVKIDRKSLECAGQSVNLMVWDIHGEDEFQKVRASYLRGMSGYFLVMDGTRKNTLDTAVKLHELAVENAGDVPFLLLVNKSDLKTEWHTDRRRMGELIDQGWDVRSTSAKSGDNVEQAFQDLTQQMLTK